MTALSRAIDDTHGIGYGQRETQEAREAAVQVRDELRVNLRR